MMIIILCSSGMPVFRGFPRFFKYFRSILCFVQIQGENHFYIGVEGFSEKISTEIDKKILGGINLLI